MSTNTGRTNASIVSANDQTKALTPANNTIRRACSTTMSAGSVVVLLASDSGGATLGTTAGWLTYRYFVTTIVTFS